MSCLSQHGFLITLLSDKEEEEGEEEGEEGSINIQFGCVCDCFFFFLYMYRETDGQREERVMEDVWRDYSLQATGEKTWRRYGG